MTTTSAFTNAGLPGDAAALLAHHVQTIEMRSMRNARLDAYYEGQNRVRDLGIAIPPGLSTIETVVGWPTMAVDVLEERLDVEGFALPGASVDNFGIPELWDANGMDVVSGMAHTDALIYGLEFVAVSVGDSARAEPDPLITIESPARMTGTWDQRRRGLSDAAGIIKSDDGQGYVAASLYLPDVTYLLDCDKGRWSLRDKQEHRRGRTMVTRLVNRPRSGRPWGTSQISRAIISYTDTAVRTVLGMEVAREFYSSPQRYMLGADESAFQDADGNPKTAWEVYLGRFLAVGPTPNGDIPQVGQLDAASPAPYLDQIKGLASLVSAEASIPVTYMGFNTDNPPGGDGVRAMEARLVKGAERRQTVFGSGWPEVVRDCVQLRDGSVPDELNRLAVVWRDAATPTKAAAADRVMKLVSVGVLPPDSEVTYEELGFSEVDKTRLMSDVRQRRTTARVAALTGAAGTATSDPAVAGLATERPTDAVDAAIG